MPKPIRRLFAAAALAALAAAPPAAAPARADELPPAGDGPKTVLKYAACSAGLAFATDFASAYGAIAYCVMTFLDEFRP